MLKNYCFELDLPPTQLYMQVRFPFDHRQLPLHLKGRHFQYVLGNTLSALELLIMEKGLKGPGWLKIQNLKPAKRLMTKALSYEWEG